VRKLVYYVASTLDGFIARADGSIEGFLGEGEHFADLIRWFPETFPGHLRGRLGVSAPNQSFDTVLMGRRTYEAGLRIGVTSPYSHLEQFVVSKSLAASPSPEVTLVREDPEGLVRRLKANTGRDIWLCGGGELASALWPEIDELVLKVNPILFGSGIPIASGRLAATTLVPIDTRAYPNGFLLLRFRLAHGVRP
jgi:dihydrofolate reductase